MEDTNASPVEVTIYRSQVIYIEINGKVLGAIAGRIHFRKQAEVVCRFSLQMKGHN